MSLNFQTARRILAACIVAAIAATMVALASGKIAYEVTEGVSMLPLYHTGDLVIVEKDSYYQLGQIIAYEGGGNGHTTVLHRIVGGDASQGFIVKGDNNQSTDPTTPGVSQIIGKAIVHVPKVGRLIQNPLTRGLIALLLMGGLVILFGRNHTSTGQARPDLVRASVHGVGSKVMLAVDVTLIAALALSLILPGSRPAATGTPLTQTGSLAYHAIPGPSATYPSGRVDTGDPVFLRLVHALDISFGYRTTATDVSGSVHVDATVSSPTGWKTTLAVVQPTPLQGGTAAVDGRLDLHQIENVAAEVSKATGVSTDTLDLAVTASVNPAVAGIPAHQFEQKLSLQLGPLEATPSASQIVATKQGPAVTSTIPLTSIPLPPHANTKAASHPLRIALLVALLLALTITAILWPAKPEEEDSDLAELRAVDVSLPKLPRIQLESREALHEVAVRLNQPVLRDPDKWQAVVTRDLVYWASEASATPSSGPN